MMWSGARPATRAVFVLLLAVSFVALAFAVGELLDDPGGLTGGLVAAGIGGTVVGLSWFAAVRPVPAQRTLGVLLALLVALALVDGVAEVMPDSWGPVVVVAAFVLAAPIGFVALRSPQLGGLMLVVAGLAPVVERGATAYRVGAGAEQLISGSAGIAAVLLCVPGVLFMLSGARSRAAPGTRSER